MLPLARLRPSPMLLRRTLATRAAPPRLYDIVAPSVALDTEAAPVEHTAEALQRSCAAQARTSAGS
jgi:hypothetical protein